MRRRVGSCSVFSRCRYTQLALLHVLVLMIAASCGQEAPDRFGNRRIATLQLETTFPHPFNYLSGVRELSNGKVVAADPVSQVLLRLDLETGTADTLGRQGTGPNEYNGPDRVFPLPGDFTLLVDLGNARLTVIDPNGLSAHSTPMTTAMRKTSGRTIQPMFVDGAGNLYDGGYYSPEAPQDTFSLRRIDRATLEETEVAAAWHAPFAKPGPGTKQPMLVLYDDWAVGGDGRIAVVRAHGYSVDWCLPDGRVVHGPPNQVETYPLGSAEKEAELEHAAAATVTTVLTVDDDGVKSMQVARGMTRGTMPSVDDFAWPETLPVFRGEATLVSPHYEVWIHRMMPAGVLGRIEVFDDQGVRLGFIEIPARSTVIGFSPSGEPGSIVYVTRTDDMGLVWLERYQVLRNDR